MATIHLVGTDDPDDWIGWLAASDPVCGRLPRRFFRPTKRWIAETGFFD